MKRRAVLSGIKKPTNVPTIKSTKSPTLFDHTTKIEQKLTRLKQQIEEKKKNIVSKPKLNIEKPVIIDQELTDFLSNINMTQYLKLLCDNGIDSLDVMREIKQKQLEQIGISKGHSLKIMVSMKKMFETREKNMRKQLSSAETAQNTQKLTSKAQRKEQNIDKQSRNKNKNHQVFITKQPKNQPLQIVIQTQSMGIGNQPLPKRRYFCLYCYQVSMDQFCGADCQQMYNKMFEKYEKNLAQVHQLYGASKVERISEIQQANQQVQQDQLVNDLNFLDIFQEEYDLNLQEYQEALEIIKITNSESKQEEIQKVLQEKQEFQQQKLYQ